MIIKGSLLAVLIAITPYLFYLYESVPDTRIWNTFFFTYESKIYESAQVVMWIVTGKLIPILLLLIWFFTCRHWWYHAILVPIIMFIYQIIGFVNTDSDIFDEFQLFHLVPVMAIIIPSIYLIRAKMFDKLNSASKTLEDLEAEFTVRPKTIWGKVKQYF
ncbi:hypothetical protein Q4512_07530 [Oceanihabitans sp. 2_MG-2023]|uniref:hypothetical protein n=1 Tax=Oceanihabitans sp. 2_MG-2023 TaxID=3062661 RepID=UPI0026E1A5C7|nr:hypothetical protein [Oceanihabitans sp. 2_MG-2023]MDO6596762.1 hypothetical protein [Oceanihabitans sp. 2_MG-2023]